MGGEEPSEGRKQLGGGCHPRVGKTRAKKPGKYIPYLSTRNSDRDPVGNSPSPTFTSPPKLYKS